MSNAKIFIGYADMNAAIWWCKWKFLAMQVSFMRMQMYVLVMQVSFMRMQMQMYVLVMYMLVINGFEPILMEVQKFIAAFLFKNRLSCLTLNFGDHHQEFFRVRSIWCFIKFSSTSLDLFLKISQFDWKWDVWKLFLGLAHEFSTIEHSKKRFLFWWISNKFNALF